MLKAHKIQLYPTKSQETLLKKSCGIARYSYNWALSKWNELYERGEETSAYSLIKLQNAIKRTEMPFFMEVSKTSPQYAIHNLERAFKNFFKKNAEHPKFKKRGVKDSFVAVENKEQFKQSDFKIHLPRIGRVKCAENLRFAGKVNNVVVKRIADKWFAIINIDCMPKDIRAKCENQAVVGIDVGIKSMAVLSDGTVIKNPKALKTQLRKLKRVQRSMDKKVKGSHNREKQKVKLSRLHYKIGCIRHDAIHKFTTDVVSKYDVIVIEDLNVVGMVKNHNLAQSIGDVSFGEIKRQLAYKTEWAKKELIFADRFFASSKTCSNCGKKKEKLKLSDRVFKCDHCGFETDRDYNASLNLKKIGTERLSETVH